MKTKKPEAKSSKKQVMKCPECGKKMEWVRNEDTVNVEVNKKYIREVYVCKSDDVWVTTETPVKE